MNQRPLTEQEVHWQAEFRELISNNSINNNAGSGAGAPLDTAHGFFSLLSKLSQELQLMKEDFSSRMIGI